MSTITRIHPPSGGGGGGGGGTGPSGSTVIVPGVIEADTLACTADDADNQITRDTAAACEVAGITGLRVKMLAGTLGTYPVVAWALAGTGGARVREMIRVNMTFDALNEELSVRIVGPAPGISFFDFAAIGIENGPDPTATFSVTPYLLEQG